MKMKRILCFEGFLVPFFSLALFACSQVNSHSSTVTTTDEKESETTGSTASATHDALMQDERVSDSVQVSDKIYEVPDMLPSYPGGNAAMLTYIGKQLNEPEYRKKVMRLGRVKSDADVKKVVVRYVVDVNGKIRDTKIVRSEGSEYDKKALDIILGMPDWIPAQHEGKTVASYFTLMICFDLD